MNSSGATMIKASVSKGHYYRNKNHYYHVGDTEILHVNVIGNIINSIDDIYVERSNDLERIRKEQFEDALRNAILELGIYKYIV